MTLGESLVPRRNSDTCRRTVKNASAAPLGVWVRSVCVFLRLQSFACEATCLAGLLGVIAVTTLPAGRIKKAEIMDQNTFTELYIDGLREIYDAEINW